MSYMHAVKSIFADTVAPQVQNLDKNAIFPKAAIAVFGKIICDMPVFG